MDLFSSSLTAPRAGKVAAIPYIGAEPVWGSAPMAFAAATASFRSARNVAVTPGFA